MLEGIAKGRAPVAVGRVKNTVKLHVVPYPGLGYEGGPRSDKYYTSQLKAGMQRGNGQTLDEDLPQV